MPSASSTTGFSVRKEQTDLIPAVENPCGTGHLSGCVQGQRISPFEYVSRIGGQYAAFHHIHLRRHRVHLVLEGQPQAGGVICDRLVLGGVKVYQPVGKGVVIEENAVLAPGAML